MVVPYSETSLMQFRAYIQSSPLQEQCMNIVLETLYSTAIQGITEISHALILKIST